MSAAKLTDWEREALALLGDERLVLGGRTFSDDVYMGLERKGLIDGVWNITDAGRAALKEQS